MQGWDGRQPVAQIRPYTRDMTILAVAAPSDTTRYTLLVATDGDLSLIHISEPTRPY